MQGKSTRHFWRSRHPARCSCCKGPWLGLPAMKTIFLTDAAASSAERTTAVNSRRRRESFIMGREKTDDQDDGKLMNHKDTETPRKPLSRFGLSVFVPLWFNAVEKLARKTN